LRRDEFDFLFIENPLSNVMFCIFLLTLKHPDFFFFFEILAHIMGFLSFLCGDDVTGHLAMETMTVSENNQLVHFCKILSINDLV